LPRIYKSITIYTKVKGFYLSKPSTYLSNVSKFPRFLDK
jgi:hypothetical protein